MTSFFDPDKNLIEDFNVQQVVAEEYIYSGTIGILTPYKPDYVVVKSDSEGK